MMDDISTIQKINATSRELRNFGFSTSSQDSVAMAKNLYTSEEDKGKSMVFGENNEAIDALSYNFKKYRESTDVRIKKLQDQIVELQEYIKQLSRTPAPRSVISSPNPPQSKAEVPETAIRNERTTESRPREKREEKPYYEKQGHFTPDDVKIEKIFYYGNK